MAQDAAATGGRAGDFNAHGAAFGSHSLVKALQIGDEVSALRVVRYSSELHLRSREPEARSPDKLVQILIAPARAPFLHSFRVIEAGEGCLWAPGNPPEIGTDLRCLTLGV